MASRDPQHDVLVVIRTCGERTLPLCRKLVVNQVPEEQVITIEEVPFSRAVYRTFELGIEHGKTWTIAVDADVLLASNAVAKMIRFARRGDPSTYKFNMYVVDRLLGQPRIGGPHLYPTALFEKAIHVIEMDKPIARPETFVLERMTEMGHGSEAVLECVGLHDFEQTYADLYRKGYQHAQKHGEEVSRLEAMWQRMAETEPDFRALLLGVADGREAGGVMTADIRSFAHAASRLDTLDDLPPKPPLDLDAWPPERIGRMIRRYRYLSEVRAERRAARRKRLLDRFVARPLRPLLNCLPAPVQRAARGLFDRMSR